MRYIVAGLLAVSVGLLIMFRPAPAAKPAAACSTDQSPCIELIGSDGKSVARFNDFRFGKAGCIWYSRLGDHHWLQYCGGTMQWIGPNPAGAKV